MRKPSHADLQKLSPEIAMNDKESMFRYSTILSSESMKHLKQQIRHFPIILSVVCTALAIVFTTELTICKKTITRPKRAILPPCLKIAI